METDKCCAVDLTRGLVVAVDIKRHTLEFICGQESFGIASASINGQAFYPFVVFNGRAHNPIRVRYLGGPKSELTMLFTPPWCNDLVFRNSALMSDEEQYFATQ